MRVHLSKKLLQQKLMANDLPVVTGCPVIMILKFVVNFCFHSFKKEFLCQFLISAISWTVFFDPKKVILRKMPIFLAKEKPNFFQLISLVKKWYKMFFSINFYSPSKSQNIPTDTLIGYLANPRMNVANKFNLFCWFSWMDIIIYSWKENHWLQMFFFWTRRR